MKCRLLHFRKIFPSQSVIYRQRWSKWTLPRAIVCLAATRHGRRVPRDSPGTLLFDNWLRFFKSSTDLRKLDNALFAYGEAAPQKREPDLIRRILPNFPRHMPL